MKQSDLQMHADIARRMLERAKAVPEPNANVIAVLAMMEQEYRTAHEIMPVGPE